MGSLRKSRKPDLEPLVYNVAEIASLMDINLISAYELAKQEDFPSIRIGRRLIIPKQAFHQWLDQQVAVSK